MPINFGRLLPLLAPLLVCILFCVGAESEIRQKKRGNIYFYWPISQGTSCRGGVAAVHYFHHALLDLNYKSLYYNNVQECFPGRYKVHRLDVWDPNDFCSEDIIILPEVLSTKYLFAFDPMEKWLPPWQDYSGARVLIWSLAALQTIPPDFLTRVTVDVEVMTHGRAQLLANSAYIREHHELLGSSRYGGVVRSALSPDFYDAWSSNWSTSVNAKGKKNLVLIDGDVNVDFLFDPRVKWQQDVVVVKLFGFSAAEVRAFYAEARVVVDLYLPGFERVVQEALLYDVVPLLADQYNGACADDFSFLQGSGEQASEIVNSRTRRRNVMELRDRLLFDPNNPQLLVDKISYALNNYDGLITHPQLQAFKQSVLNQPVTIPLSVERWAQSSDVTVVMASCSDTDDVLLLGSVLTLLHFYPMISVEVRVRHVEDFLLRNAILVGMLAKQGYTSRSGGMSYHSVRFRPVNEFYVSQSEYSDTTTASTSEGADIVDVCLNSAGDFIKFLSSSDSVSGALNVSSSHGQYVILLPRADLLLGPSILFELLDAFHAVRAADKTEVPLASAVPLLLCPKLQRGPVKVDAEGYLGRVCIGHIPQPLKANDHQLFALGGAGDEFSFLTNDILGVQRDFTLREQCSYMQLRSGDASGLEFCETPDQESLLEAGFAELPRELREHPMWLHYFHHSVARIQPEWVFTTRSCVCVPLEAWIEGSIPSNPWREALQRLPYAPTTLSAMMDGMKLTVDDTGMVIVNTDMRFYVIDATDTLTTEAWPYTFSYLFPSTDVDSVGSGGGVSAYLSIPARPSADHLGYPLYNRGVIEPGLTRIWYDVLLNRISESSPLVGPGGARITQQIVVDVGGNFGYYSLLGASMNRMTRAKDRVPATSGSSPMSYKVVVFEPVSNFSAGKLSRICN